MRQFGAHVAQAIVNARLFESEREYAETLATLAEIGREMSAILDLDELLTRLAHLIKRVIDYSIFGIALVREETGMLEMKVAIQYGDDARAMDPLPIGEGLVGYAALHKQPVLVADVTKDPRYVNAVPGVRSELVVPLLLKDRCIGVFDLESPELAAFSKKHVELLTLLASQAAVAIENARLYESIRANEARYREGAAVRATGAEGAPAASTYRKSCAVSTSPGISTRRTSSAATCSTFSRPSRTRWSSPSETCPERASRRRSTAPRLAR